MFRRLLRWLAVSTASPPPAVVEPQVGTAAFLDSNIFLECRPLKELAWAEVDPVGPIFAYAVPQVLVEVDRYKQDGRLQVWARQLNKLMGPIATRSLAEIVLLEAPVRVTLRLANPGRIDWQPLDGLDREDGDSRIVAEALHTDVSVGLRKVVVSHDLGPIAKASRHGLATLRVDDSWLRPPEPHRSEREAARLRDEVQRLAKEQPELGIKLRCLTPMPVAIHRVSQIDSAGRAQLSDFLISDLPQPTGRDWFAGPDFRARGVTEEQIDEHIDKAVPNFLDQLPTQLELRYGQVQIVLKIENSDNVHAARLIVKVSASGGWLNHGVLLTTVGGPPKPAPYDAFKAMRAMQLNAAPAVRGSTELAWTKKPFKSREAELQCDDFRAGRSEEITLAFWIDPRSGQDAVVHVETSALNLKGMLHTHLSITKTVVDSTWDELLEVGGKSRLPYPTEAALTAAAQRGSFDGFEFPSER